MRPIDADAFKEYLKNAFEEVKHMYPDGGEFARQITEDFCRDIDEQPTIKAEPERKNEPVGCNGCRYDWFGDPRCAKCARSFQDYYEADMRGEQDDS